MLSLLRHRVWEQKSMGLFSVNSFWEVCLVTAGIASSPFLSPSFSGTLVSSVIPFLSLSFISLTFLKVFFVFASFSELV